MPAQVACWIDCNGSINDSSNTMHLAAEIRPTLLMPLFIYGHLVGPQLSQYAAFCHAIIWISAWLTS